MALFNFEFKRKESVFVCANALIQPSVAETFLHCSNHLTAISIALAQRYDKNDELVRALVKQVDRTQYRLLVSEWPVPAGELTAIRQDVSFLYLYNKEYSAQVGTQSISVRIDKVVDALESEMDNGISMNTVMIPSSANQNEHKNESML